MRLQLVWSLAMTAGLMSVATAQEPSDTLEKIRRAARSSSGIANLRSLSLISTRATRSTGYAVDLCYLVADAVKATLGLDRLEVKLVPVTPSNRIQSVLSGSIDLECDTMTNNLERQKVVAFSVTYFVAANRFVSKSAANLRDAGGSQGQDGGLDHRHHQSQADQRAQCAAASRPDHHRRQGP